MSSTAFDKAQNYRQSDIQVGAVVFCHLRFIMPACNLLCLYLYFREDRKLYQKDSLIGANNSHINTQLLHEPTETN